MTTNEDNGGQNIDADSDNGNKEPIVSAEKARHQYMAERELAEFAKLYFARASEEMICQTLKISRATYYRWLDKLGHQQKELLNDHLEASTYAEIASFRNTLRFVEIHMKTILLNRESEDEAKIEAAQLLCDVAYAQVKTLTGGTIQTMKEMPAELKNKILEINKNEPQQQLPEVIEIKPEDIKTEKEEGEEERKGKKEDANKDRSKV